MSVEKNQNRVFKLVKPFAGRWVAVTADESRVVSVAKTAKIAFRQAQKKGEKCPLLIKAPDSSTAAFIF